MPLFSTVLAITIGSHYLFDFWLDRRQTRYVRAHQDSVPAPFTNAVALADHRKAAAYTVARKRLDIWSDLTNLLLLIGLIFGGGFAFLQAAISSFAGTGYIGSVALTIALAAVMAAISMPFAYYRTFAIEAHFGFNRTTRTLFATDFVKSCLLGIAFLTPLVLGIDFSMRELGSNWWVLAWVLWVAFNLLAMLIVPTFIMPLFNKFESLEDGELKTRIEALMTRCGFKSRGVFKMDGSKRSSHGNAFFTGLGSSKCIVIFDTLIEKLSNDEIEAVLAHELGHFKRRHILKRMIISFAVSFLVFAGLGFVSRQAWFYEGFGVDFSIAIASPFVAFLLFALAFPSFSHWFKFASNYMSRLHEFEADSYAASHARSTDLASALVKLHRDNAATLTPDPLYTLVNYSHPTAEQRIARLVPVAGQPFGIGPNTPSV
jgi:STE24 endopeptidase